MMSRMTSMDVEALEDELFEQGVQMTELDRVKD